MRDDGEQLLLTDRQLKRPNGLSDVYKIRVSMTKEVFNSKSLHLGNKTVEDLDEPENGRSPLPVDNMQGSLSLSDIPISTSPGASSPRAEVVSIDENESSVITDSEHKIV